MSRKNVSRLTALCAVLAVLGCVATTASAAPTNYALVIDSSQSFLTLSGVATVAPFPPIPILNQDDQLVGDGLPSQAGGPPFGTDGDTAFYGGTLNAEIDTVANTIRFPGLSQIDAIVSGSWSPDPAALPPVVPYNYAPPINTLSQAPADYGTQLGSVVWTSIQNYILDAQSLTPPKPIVAGAFPLAGELYQVRNGNLAVADTVGGAVTTGANISLLGLAFFSTPGFGSVTILPNLVEVTLPIKVSQNASIAGAPVTLNFEGQIVARVVPEPSSVALAGLGLIGLVPVALRRFRKA